MRKEILSVAIVGHVDHGKSTLIGRLLLDTRSLPDGRLNELKEIARQLGREAELAHLADQLKEERIANATIDTTQLFFATHKRSYCIIDTPGHIEFLKNMISGASLAECAILIVDAQEGIKEQTRRHLFILKMLGITQVVVAINKMDLVGFGKERFDELATLLGAFARTLGALRMHCVPLSAKEGDNVLVASRSMRWYRGMTLCEYLDGLRQSRAVAGGSCVLPVQDVYEIDGERVIAGTLLCGVVAEGQKVAFLPDRAAATVEKILIFGKKTVRQARAGESIGVIVSGSSACRRGQVMAAQEDSLSPARSVRANVFWLSGKPLSRSEKLHLRIATQEVPCVVTAVERRIDSSTLAVLEGEGGCVHQNEAASVVITAEQPFVAEEFARLPELGRFVLESDHALRGAGTVTEVMAG